MRKSFEEDLNTEEGARGSVLNMTYMRRFLVIFAKLISPFLPQIGHFSGQIGQTDLKSVQFDVEIRMSWRVVILPLVHGVQ